MSNQHNSSDYNIKAFEFKDSARIQEKGGLNINPHSSVENEDYRAKARVGMIGDVSDKRNFMSDQRCETEESLTKLSLERTGEENADNYVSENQQSGSEGCASEFPVNTSMEVAGKREDRNEYDSGPLSEVINEHNDENRGPMIHQIIKQVETNSLLPQLMLDNTVKKGKLLSHQMAKSENIDSESLPYIREDSNRKYGSVDAQVFEDNGLETNSPSSTGVENDHSQNSSTGDYQRRSLVNQQFTGTNNSETKSPTDITERSCEEKDSNIFQGKEGKYFYYDSPLYEETGIWIPVSIPPMSESERQEWTRGFCSNGGYEGDEGWGLCLGKEKELTMWDVVLEMLLVAKGKVNALASGDIPDISWISGQLIEQAWKEMAQTLTESSLSNVQEMLESEPPKWLPDSTASTCMLCSVRFHPIMCTRHHCRFCGGVFCSDCTRGRSLLPEKFRTANPQRVCDVCCVRLESVQPYLMDQVSRAAQLPTHDLTDLSTLRSWMNFPWGQSMEYEIYKATNTIRGYRQVGSLKPEKRIPEAILRHAKGLAILTIAKVGVMVTYNIGTGLVIARREDGSWSPPSAISSFGVGWGAQAGGELTDLIIVLTTDDAVRTFSGNTHLSVGAGLSAAIGIIGRTAEADLRAGTSGYATCYTYSCSKGAFIGCSLEGSIVVTRAQENSRFYGSQSITASDILLGSLPRPPAASILYRALTDLYQKL